MVRELLETCKCAFAYGAGNFRAIIGSGKKSFTRATAVLFIVDDAVWRFTVVGEAGV